MSKALRILFFTNGGNSGAETVIYELVSHLDRTRFEAEVVTLRTGNLFPRLTPAVKVHDAEKWQESRRSLLFRAEDKIYRRLTGYRGSRFHRKILSQFRPDLVYVNSLSLPFHVDDVLIRNIPFVVHTHSLEEFMFTLPYSHIRRMLGNAALTIACSQAQAEVNRLLGRTGPMEVVYPSINLDAVTKNRKDRHLVRQELSIPGDHFLWVSVGAYFNHNKNPVRFVDIAGETLGRWPRTRFVWAGGNLEDTAAVFAANKAGMLHIPGAVTFTGRLSGDHYYDLLNAADGILLASHQESFSIAALEAMALKKPVVAFPAGGVTEALDRRCSIIVDSLNNSDLVEAMLKVTDGSFRPDGESAANFAAKFDTKVIVKRWEELMLKYF